VHGLCRSRGRPIQVTRSPDAKDKFLITLLRNSARAPVTLLARKMGMSCSAVQQRLARLERDRVIAGYTVRLTQDLDAAPFRAYVMLSVNPKDSVAWSHLSSGRRRFRPATL